MVSFQCISKYLNRDERLEQLEDEQKQSLIQRLFKVDTSTFIADLYDPYFENYSTQIKSFNLGPNSSMLSALERDRRLQPYLVSVVEKLLTEPKSPRQSVKEHVKRVAEEQKLLEKDDTFFDRSIDLALQVWLMLNSRDRANDTSPVTKWEGDKSLDHLVKELFPVEDESTDLRFNYRFTAANIERNSGVKIVWTRYLSEHLSFDDEQDYRKLKIFPYKHWLNDMLNLAKLKIPSESSKTAKHDESMADSDDHQQLGETTTVTGEAATATGTDIIATGQAARAIGKDTTAKSEDAAAKSEAAIAKEEYQTVNGKHTSRNPSTANGLSKHATKHSNVPVHELM